jgi:hypothetical protein
LFWIIIEVFWITHVNKRTSFFSLTPRHKHPKKQDESKDIKINRESSTLMILYEYR